VAIEKVFAIEGTAGPIWDQLWQEIQASADAATVVEESHRPHSLVLRLDLGGIDSRLRYEIEEQEDHCEVSGAIEPLSFRYKLYQLLTFGHMRVNFEMMLAEGLANLKAAVEGGEAAD
jgi:hypothetical protein